MLLYMGLFLYITWEVTEEHTEEHLKFLEKAIAAEQQYPEIKSLRTYRKMFGASGGVLGGRILKVIEIMEFESMTTYEKWCLDRKLEEEFANSNKAAYKNIIPNSFRMYIMQDILRDSWTER